MNILDSAISSISPKWGLRRQLARHALTKVKAYHDGADQGRRGASIRRNSVDANAVSRKTLPSLRSGSHDLLRNNPHAKRGVEAIVSNVVGKGVFPQFVKDEKADNQLNGLVVPFLNSKDCDADGRHDYFGLQSLAFKAMVEGGEVLVRRRIRPRSDGLALPVQFQVLEGEFLDHTREGSVEGGGYIIQGVQFNSIGKRVGYWLFDKHPGGDSFAGLPSSKFVRASEVIHIYRSDRAGQVRGVPWLAPVMLRIQDFADYEEAQLVRQKIAACYAAFITDIQEGTAGLPVPAKDLEQDERLRGFEPGMIEDLPPGREIKFADPPTVDEYADYAKVSLRAIAAGLGISYEALTMDLQGVSFTSGRMGWLEFHRNIEVWRWLLFIPQFCEEICKWALDAAEMNGQDIAGVSVKHTPPRREMINPSQEIAANTAAVRSGQKTLSQIIQEGGRDPSEHLNELAKDKGLFDTLGLILDSDPSKVSAAGLTQARADGTTVDGVFNGGNADE